MTSYMIVMTVKMMPIQDHEKNEIFCEIIVCFPAAAAWTNIPRIHIGVLPEKITGIIEPTSERGQTEIFDFFIGGGSGKEEVGGQKEKMFYIEKWLHHA